MNKSDLYIKHSLLNEDGLEEISLFPSESCALKISSYTYESKRMGGAPTLTATIYSMEPIVWNKGAFVEFLGERFYVSYTPSMSKDNSSLMYKYDVTFTSQREILDNTLFFDVVSEDASSQDEDKYRSNQTSFKFGGTIDEFVSRINSSLSYCGIYRPTSSSDKGYYVVVDEGYGTDDVKEVSFEDQYITDVLQLIYSTFGLTYYWIGKVCHVGKQQSDLSIDGNFAKKYVLSYGRNNELLSISKENANSKVVDMITGHGSSDNIPYYYPNDDEYGKAVFETENFDKSLVQNINLGKVFGWNSNIYNEILSLGKNSEQEYSANVYGLSQYLASVYTSETGSGVGEGAKSVIFHAKMGEFYSSSGTSSSSRLQSEAVTYFLFAFNSIQNGSVKLDDLKFNATEDEGQDKFGLIFNYEYSYYVGDDMDIATAFKHLKNAGKEDEADEDHSHSGSFGGSVANASKAWSFGDNLVGLRNFTKSEEKICSFVSSTKTVIVIGCRITASNIAVAKGTKKLNGISITASGNVTYAYRPSSEYYFTYGNDKSVPYDESGIEINDIKNLPHNSTSFSFNGTDWLIEKENADNVAKIHVTDRIWILPSQYLMPSIYRSSNGAERFYYALNRTHLLPGGSGEYYKFANEYKEGVPHQGSVSFDDIKPTINGVRNDVIRKDGLGQLFGEIADVAFDSGDSDVKDSDDNYVHSYFYIKLHKFSGDYGFDLFKHILASESAKINLIKSNGCPACSFEIGCYWDSQKAKCYNNVQTDGDGNLKSYRTDANDYILPDSLVEEQTANQDSTKEELWICVKKDDSTLGTIMPNASAGFKPQKGDLFVLTGIKPPKVLITAAEKRLDEALIKYMSENNEDQFNYSVKFSRIYLQNNADFSDLLNENSKLSVHVDGEYAEDGSELYHNLFVSEYSVKADEDILCEVSVTLVNSLETTEGDAKNIVDAVKDDVAQSVTNRLGNKGSSSSFNASVADKMYLSKQQADTAKGRITFEQGLTSDGDADINGDERVGGDERVEGNAEVGKDLGVHGDATVDGNLNVGGETYLKDLTVSGSAHFFELVIDKIKAAGGTYIFSAANSFNVDRVIAGNNVVRLYWLAENGGKGSMNTWEVGDQAISMDFNRAKVGETFSASNKYWWALVTATSGDTPESVEEENGTKHLYHWIEVSTLEKADGCTVEAEVGDAVAQWGSRSADKKRQAAQMIAAYKSPDTGVEAPCWVQYVGINSFTITEDNRLNRVAYNGNVFKGSFVATSEGEQGRDLLEWLESLQRENDTHFDIWYGDEVPSLENEPAVEWTTDSKKAEHVDDLYFDRSDTAKSDGGHCYRFVATTKDSLTTYTWEDYTDHDTLKALTKAQNIADDGVVTAGTEKMQLLITLKNMQSEFSSFSEPTTDSSVSYTQAYGAYKKAYNNFVSATQDIVSDANIGKDTILSDIGLTSESYVNLYYNYYSTLGKMLEASEASIKASISTIGGRIEMAVTKNGLKTAGMTVEDEHITLDAKKTTVKGDLTVQGAITDSTSYVGMDGSLWSPNEVGELEKSSANLLVGDGNTLFVPVDMSTIKSVQIQTADPSLVSDGNPTNASTALVTLPMYDAVDLGCGVTMPAYRRSGTHVLVRNAFSLSYNQWSKGDGWTNGDLRRNITSAAVYICTDPRTLALSNYSASAPAITADGRGDGGATADYFKGCMSLNGRRGRWLVLLPGQQVELVSVITMWQTGTNTPVPYLSWYVAGGDGMDWLEKTVSFRPDGTGYTEYDAVFRSAVTGGEHFGIGGIDKYADAFFGYPKLSDASNLSEQVVVTLSADSKPYITIE